MKSKWIILWVLFLVIPSSYAANYKPWEYDSKTRRLISYKGNFALSIPKGYILASELEMDRIRQSSSRQINEDTFLFRNRRRNISFVIGYSSHVIYPGGGRGVIYKSDKSRLLKYWKRRALSKYKKNADKFNGKVELKGDYLLKEEIDSSDKENIKLSKKLTHFYPLDKNSSRYAIFTINMYSYQKNFKPINRVFDEMFSTLDLTPFSKEERLEE